MAPGPVLTNLADSFAERNGNLTLVEGQQDEPYVFENQDPSKPAIAAVHLLSQNVFGKCIFVFGGRYREIEGVYESIREDMFGGAIGMPPNSDKGWRNLFACSF